MKCVNLPAPLQRELCHHLLVFTSQISNDELDPSSLRNSNNKPQLSFCPQFLMRVHGRCNINRDNMMTYYESVLEYHVKVRRPQGAFDLNMDDNALAAPCSLCSGCRQVDCPLSFPIIVIGSSQHIISVYWAGLLRTVRSAHAQCRVAAAPSSGPALRRPPAPALVRPPLYSTPLRYTKLTYIHTNIHAATLCRARQESLVKCTGITAAPLSQSGAVQWWPWSKDKAPADWLRVVGGLHPDRDVLLFPAAGAVPAELFPWTRTRSGEELEEALSGTLSGLQLCYSSPTTSSSSSSSSSLSVPSPPGGLDGEDNNNNSNTIGGSNVASGGWWCWRARGTTPRPWPRR